MDFVALQEALDPPFIPLHDQVQGPEPATELGDPVPQRFVVGIEVNDHPFALPQVPCILVLQEAVVPPLEPIQDHV